MWITRNNEWEIETTYCKGYCSNWLNTNICGNSCRNNEFSDIIITKESTYQKLDNILKDLY